MSVKNGHKSTNRIYKQKITSQPNHNITYY